jgi:hypothetical protein
LGGAEEEAADEGGEGSHARIKRRKQLHPKMSPISGDYDPKAAEMLRSMFRAEAAEKAAAVKAQHNAEEAAAMCTAPKKKERKKRKAPAKPRNASEQDF